MEVRRASENSFREEDMHRPYFLNDPQTLFQFTLIVSVNSTLSPFTEETLMKKCFSSTWHSMFLFHFGLVYCMPYTDSPLQRFDLYFWLCNGVKVICIQ